MSDMPTPGRSSSGKALKSPSASSTRTARSLLQEEAPATPQHGAATVGQSFFQATPQNGYGGREGDKAREPPQRLEPLVAFELVNAWGAAAEQLEQHGGAAEEPPLLRGQVVQEDTVGAGQAAREDTGYADILPSSSRGKFRLRRVVVDALHADNTLGLLLHGTSVVGFRIAEAQDAGWCQGDQIVEVNEQRVRTYDEFLERFRHAQREDGFPIVFSVLRREDPCEAGETAEDTLQNFFSNTDFANLNGQLLQRWGTPLEVPESPSNGAVDAAAPSVISLGPPVDPPTSANDASAATNSAENPFVQALNNRRDALFRSSEGWAKWADDDFANKNDSIASRLAQRQDGVSTLQFSRGEESYTTMPEQQSCSWPWCLPTSINVRRRFQTVDYELAPTPRVHHYEQPDSRFDPNVEPPWLVSAAASRSRASDDFKPPIIEAASALAGPSNEGVAEVPERAPRKNSDSSILAQLLLASLAQEAESDEEGAPEGVAPPQPGGAEAAAPPSGPATPAGNDLEIWLPRRQPTQDAPCKGITHARAEALLVGKALV